jgi:hypothetical protein
MHSVYFFSSWVRVSMIMLCCFLYEAVTSDRAAVLRTLLSHRFYDVVGIVLLVSIVGLA